MNFCCDFLSFVKHTVTEDNPKWVPLLEASVGKKLFWNDFKHIFMDYSGPFCFSVWCTCSPMSPTEMWPLLSTGTPSIPSCHTGMWRKLLAPSTDIPFMVHWDTYVGLLFKLKYLLLQNFNILHIYLWLLGLLKTYFLNFIFVWW